MEEIEKLSDDELGNVVGGLADLESVQHAFGSAQWDFFSLRTNHPENNTESSRILSLMFCACRHGNELTSVSEREIHRYVNQLEEYYKDLVNTQVHERILESARSILDRLKSVLGL